MAMRKTGSYGGKFYSHDNDSQLWSHVIREFNELKANPSSAVEMQNGAIQVIQVKQVIQAK